MVKEYKYDKVVDGAQLHNELRAANYEVETVFSKYDPDDPSLSVAYCKVVLKDSESKDPTPIVEAHIPTPEEPARDLANEIDELKARVEKLEKGKQI